MEQQPTSEQPTPAPPAQEPTQQPAVTETPSSSETTSKESSRKRSRSRDRRRKRSRSRDRRGSRRRRSRDRDRDRNRDRDRDRDRRRRDKKRSRSSSRKRSKNESEGEPNEEKDDRAERDEKEDEERKARRARRKKRGGFSDAPPPGTVATSKFSSVPPVGGVAAALQYRAHLRSNLISQQQMQAMNHLARQARRSYIGNVAPHITEQELKNFLNKIVTSHPERPVNSHPEAVFTMVVNHPKMFAFVEFHSKDDADIACCMDGIDFNGTTLKIRRPKDYTPPTEGPLKPKKYFMPGIISTHVEDDGGKIFLGNLPPDLTAKECQEFVSTFGQLAAFNLVKDLITNESKGYAFLAYKDSSITEVACKGLNGISLRGKIICCQRAQSNSLEKADLNLDSLAKVPDADIKALQAGLVIEPTEVVVIHNAVTPEELQLEYDSILEEMEQRCTRYGTLKHLVGEGNKIYLKYGDSQSAEQAVADLQGRVFSNRHLLTCYFKLDKWQELIQRKAPKAVADAPAPIVPAPAVV